MSYESSIQPMRGDQGVKADTLHWSGPIGGEGGVSYHTPPRPANGMVWKLTTCPHRLMIKGLSKYNTNFTHSIRSSKVTFIYWSFVVTPCVTKSNHFFRKDSKGPLCQPKALLTPCAQKLSLFHEEPRGPFWPSPRLQPFAGEREKHPIMHLFSSRNK